VLIIISWHKISVSETGKTPLGVDSLCVVTVFFLALSAITVNLGTVEFGIIGRVSKVLVSWLNLVGKSPCEITKASCNHKATGRIYCSVAFNFFRR